MLHDRRRFVILADQDVGEGFVVAQQHVVARAQALDEVRLEQQRLGLRARRHEFHLPRLADHPRDALGVAAQPRVIGDALLQRAGLADIEDVAVLAEHAIDARLVRQPLGERGDEFGPGEVARQLLAGIVPVDRGQQRCTRRGRIAVRGFAALVQLIGLGAVDQIVVCLFRLVDHFILAGEGLGAASGYLESGSAMRRPRGCRGGCAPSI